MPAERRRVRLNVWSPTDAPWDSPISAADAEQMAESAVISGATPTEAEILSMLADNPGLFVNAQRLALR